MLSKDVSDAMVDDLCATLDAPGILDGGLRSSGSASAATAAQPMPQAQGDDTVRAAVAYEQTNFVDPYERLPSKGSLYKPHDAEYEDFAYKLAIEQLRASGLHSGNYRDRAWPSGRAINLGTCKIVTTLIPVTQSTCEVTDSQPASIPVPPACIPNPGKIAGKVCWAAYGVLKALEFICEDNKNQLRYVDRSINGMQTLATHENTRKTMDNQKILWDQTDASFKALTQELEDWYKAMTGRQAKTENDVAAVQRETNFLRRLILTPETARPGWNCAGRAIATQNPPPKTTMSCTESCRLSAPDSTISSDITLGYTPPSSVISSTTC